MMDALLDIWMDEIRRFNRTLNLVGPEVLKNIESEIELCLKLTGEIKEKVLADLGTGSGIPGIPYAVMNPGSKIKLIERSEKKCIFLKRAVALMGLENVEVLQTDPLIDDIGRYPAVISRAFSPKETLSKAVAAVLEDGGVFYYIANRAPLLDDRFLVQEDTEPAESDEVIGIYSYRFSLLK